MLLALVVALSVIVPTGAWAQDFEAVERQKNALEDQIDKAAAELDDLTARIALTRDELGSLEQRAADLEAEAREAGEALEVRARATFKRGESSGLESLFTSDGPDGARERARLLAALSRRDLAALQHSSALRTQLQQTGELLAARATDLLQLEAQMVQRGEELQARFVEVSEVYRELKTRKDRQRLITRGAQQGLYACIMQGAYHFRDTWGHPRSGGRRHKGTDVMAPYGAPVYAFTTGRIRQFSSSGLGGIGLYLWGDDGVQYYYAHLKGYAAGIHPGKRVEAGQLVAYNGSTGNADRGAPHVHFEVHPGGGGAINPYHWLTPVC
ncbi:MAG: peptidoglycan DD-metalloendopeptidase family protein [Actinobacteria bacterium]|nr:peptidoglycan DD-metalloendopeptidase family protein [Actinomycetota bacterium]